MIIVGEQYGYKKPRTLDKDISKHHPILNEQSYIKEFKQKKDKTICFQIDYNKTAKDYEFQTSYFVGVDWIVENELSIYIEPKVNKNNIEVSYLEMLLEALKETENLNHLDHLCEIYFDKPTITIDQKQDLLSPLLVVQYLHLLRRIVQKGLKKTYYPVVKNLNAKVKGKILVNATIKNNHTKSKMLYSYCKYDEFGLNSVENKVLKKALLFSQKAIQNFRSVDTSALNSLFNYIQPAFIQVDNEVQVEELKTIKPNPLYKEYEQALKLAKLILKRYSYTISEINPTKIQTPPFWIDMSKLFELYVFAKLKQRFPEKNEVIYHKNINYLELDFLINSKRENIFMVVDAKYKPQYADRKIHKEDLRQVAGYARLKEVYVILKVDYNKNIDCLIIYPNLDGGNLNYLEVDLKANPLKKYVGMYKLDLNLPFSNKEVTI